MSSSEVTLTEERTAAPATEIVAPSPPAYGARTATNSTDWAR